LEDKTGKVTVRVREKQIENAVQVLTSGEPVVVSGKLRFPESSQDGEEGDAGPQLPTLMLDSAELLSEVVRSETRRVALHLDASFVTQEMIRGLGPVLKSARGPCPVVLILRVERAKVHLALPNTLSVAPSNEFFASLEQHFGRQVASLT
jgi:DNA polymerase III alpha subunit